MATDFSGSGSEGWRLAHLLINEVVPLCGFLRLSSPNHGTNLLPHLMTDVCRLLGTKKLNMTDYHPQCNGMVEHFDHMLKTVVRKHADVFSKQ